MPKRGVKYMKIKDVIQAYSVRKGVNNGRNTTSYIAIGKSMKSGADKVEFFNFLESKSATRKDFSSLDKDYIVGKKRPNKRQGYYEAITENGKTHNYWINWPTQATGDLTSMSAAILMGFQHGIRIVQGNDNVSPMGRIDLVSAFLGGVVDPSDNHFIINKDGWKGTYDEKNVSKSSLKFSWLTNVVATGNYNVNGNIIDTIRSTNTRNGYNANAKNIIRNAWLGDKNRNQAIGRWLERKCQLKESDLRNKLITILWIRKSGERGGAHYENDTSFSAIEGYLTNHTAGYYFLAGDDKLDKYGKSKAQKIASSKPNVYNLTKFWEDPSVKAWNGNTRTGQFGLYDYLYTISGGNLIHVGSMSGGLEALALLGHKVKFKAKKGEIGVNRMERYKNTPIHYDRINFEGNHFYYDYRGFEKSSAKFYAFFSSGVISQRFNEGSDIKGELYEIYNRYYNPEIDYKISGTGLSGRNAKIAIEVSKELAHKEKKQIRKRIEDEKKRGKLKVKNQEAIIKSGNPNHK